MAKQIIKICPVCNIPIRAKRTRQQLADMKMDVDKQFHKRPCKTCREMMGKCVTLICRKCDSVTMANPNIFKEILPEAKAGYYADIEECTKCSEDKQFHFLAVTNKDEE